MTIDEAHTIARSFHERVRGVSAESQTSEHARLGDAARAIDDLANQLADPKLAKAAYDTEQARLKAVEDAEKAQAKADAPPVKAEPDEVKGVKFKSDEAPSKKAAKS